MAVTLQDWVKNNKYMPEQNNPTYQISNNNQQSPIASAMNQQSQGNYQDLPYAQQLGMFQSDPTLGKSELSRAMNQANLYKATGDTGAYDRANTWIGQINTATGGKLQDNPQNQSNNYLQQAVQGMTQQPRQVSAPTPFSYNKDNDQAYQSALQSALQNAQTASNNAMVGLGNRGIANSSIAVDRANQIQQREVGNVTRDVLPQLIQQAFARYQDQNNNQFKVDDANYNRSQDYNKNILGLSDVYNRLGQQEVSNQRTAIQDQLQKQQANLGAATTVGQQLGRVLQPKDDWSNLYNQNDAPMSLQGQGQSFNQGMEQQKFDYTKGQNDIQNTAQYAGMYNGQPTMQKIMQDATIQNMTADNLRAAASEARAAGNNQLAKRFDIWDRTGVAPDGIPGVSAGTPLGGKKSTAQTAETYSKVIDGVAKYSKDEDGKQVLSNPQQVEDTILLSGLSDYEQYRLYKQHDIPWDDPIPQAPGKQ